MTITLDTIQAEQQRLAKLIEQFVSQGNVEEYRVPQADIELGQGEHYAGLMLDEDGNPSHHLILLPGQSTGTNWSGAQDWAAEQGGELPTRREQALLFANLPGHFEKQWYWSAERHKGGSGCAWLQNFSFGSQGSFSVDVELRARAVRRLVID